jgi:hypothetical protein
VSRVTLREKYRDSLHAELAQEIGDLVLSDCKALRALGHRPEKAVWSLLCSPVDEQRQKRSCGRARNTE